MPEIHITLSSLVGSAGKKASIEHHYKKKWHSVAIKTRKPKRGDQNSKN
jgi:hypothetical protein